MSVDAALPSHLWQTANVVLTFVVPAPQGCNLSCPFCFVRQRGEDRATSELKPPDYARFIQEASAALNVDALCIQGYEPLLPAAFGYTKAIVEAGSRLGIPTSFVTNGTHLASRIDDLCELAPARIAVSLDAASARAHDRLRGPGAFDATMKGLEAASRLGPPFELDVTSVLLPNKRAQLEGLPALLAQKDIQRWAVTVLQRVGKHRPGGAVGERSKILDDLAFLQDIAQREGIVFAVDDEFDGLRTTEVDRLRVRRLARPDSIYRLAPDGRCAKGFGILQMLHQGMSPWQPRMDAGAFLLAL